MSAAGRVVRLSGATVDVAGLDAPAIDERVQVGPERLPAEVVRLRDGVATLQVYEDTAGLRVGDSAEATGAPFVVELGPGLLGGVFDGVQRPMQALAADGPFIVRGRDVAALDRARRWRFEPAVAAGDEVAPGRVLGHVAETRAVRHAVLFPPDAPPGRIAEVFGGDRTVLEPIVRLEDARAMTLLARWPSRRPRPVSARLAPSVPFLTGQRILDCLFPVAAGGTAIVPGGFGTGKTVLEQSLARHAAADVIVYVGCGERGNEMTELLDEFPKLVDPRTGAPLMERTVMIVNTSNMPVAAREASMFTGVAIAEYFRDMGLSVALMVDSTSRWAEALREISARLEEMPGEEGYPTYLATRLGAFYERAGRVTTLGGREASVTIVGAISPAGGDFSEPVTQASSRLAGALWALTPDLARRRHFPAIDWAQSFSLDAERLFPWFAREAGDRWPAARAAALRLLQRESELTEIVQLVGLASLEDRDRVDLEAARLVREGFLRQSAYHPVDASCPPAKTLAMLELYLFFAERARAAIDAGRTIGEVLAAAPSETLTRLGEMAPEDLATEAPLLRARIESALAPPATREAV